VVGFSSRTLFQWTVRHARNACRWHFSGPLDEALRDGRQVVVTSWHQDVIPLFHYLVNYSKLQHRRRFVMMSSRSFDGELVQRLVAPWGFRFVRGSRGKKGGRAAFKGLRRALRDGFSVVIIGDGPGPPPFEMKPGPVHLASLSGVPLFAVRAWARPQIVWARSWARYALPLPRCDVAIFSEGPVDVSGDAEEARLRAQEALLKLGEEADAHLYLCERVLGGVPLDQRAV